MTPEHIKNKAVQLYEEGMSQENVLKFLSNLNYKHSSGTLKKWVIERGGQVREKHIIEFLTEEEMEILYNITNRSSCLTEIKEAFRKFEESIGKQTFRSTKTLKFYISKMGLRIVKNSKWSREEDQIIFDVIEFDNDKSINRITNLLHEAGCTKTDNEILKRIRVLAKMQLPKSKNLLKMTDEKANKVAGLCRVCLKEVLKTEFSRIAWVCKKCYIDGKYETEYYSNYREHKLPGGNFVER